MQRAKRNYLLSCDRSSSLSNTMIGMSLIECMLALLLSGLAVSFILELYRNMKMNHVFIESIYKSFTESKTLITLINSEVHAAGRMSCEKVSKKNRLYDNKKEQFQSITPMHVEHDAIHFFHTHAEYGLAKMNHVNQSYIDVISSLLFYRGDRILISDCIYSELATITAVEKLATNKQRLYITNQLHFPFQRHGRVAKFEIIDIFLKKIKKQTFVMLSVNGHSTTLTDSIDNLIFLKKTDQAVSFQFDSVVGPIKKRWYGYASTRS